MIDLTLPAGALQRSTLNTLVEELTATVLHWEGVADNPATRAMAWAFVHELRSGAINVGGKPAELPVTGLSNRATGLAGYYRPAQGAAPQRTGARGDRAGAHRRGRDQHRGTHPPRLVHAQRAVRGPSGARPAAFLRMTDWTRSPGRRDSDYLAFAE